MSDSILNITLKKAQPVPAEPAGGYSADLSGQGFRGPESTPFLAPRGVFVKNNQLLVSDTGRNRVFIWRQIPQGIFQEPDVVLGQGDADGTGRNAGGEVSADTLQYPSGLWTDGLRLIVADAWNHRVLIWNHMPGLSGQPADVVLGQPDMRANLPNTGGIGIAPEARSLYWPYGVFSDGKSLWVADTGNRRVLYFEEIPSSSFTPATAVIGQPDFNSRDYDSRNAIWPYSVRIGPDGELAIVDTQYYRVLLWSHWKKALTDSPDGIIGQPDLDSNGQNQFGLFPRENTLSWCYDAFFDHKGLLIADTGNSRILHFPSMTGGFNFPATGLWGKPDFCTGSENADTVFGTEKTLYWPFSICTEGERLVVADTGNHRIIFYPR